MGVDESRGGGIARLPIDPFRPHAVEIGPGGAQQIVAVDDDHGENFAEAQGGDGEVVAAEAQGGQADDNPHQRCDDDGGERRGQKNQNKNDRRREMQKPMPEMDLRQKELRLSGHDNGGVGAGGEEAGMANRELAGQAQDKIEPQRQDDVDGDVIKQRMGVARQQGMRCAEVEERGNNRGRQSDADQHGGMGERFFPRLSQEGSASDLFRDRLAEDALGFEEQDGDEQNEGDGVFIARAAVAKRRGSR